MNQQKTGAFLKHLRKSKGLTQEQLAERFYVSSRTVSRWETGSNMPDVDMLIELADFYDVDIREIIDGERKGEVMDKETKDTLKKVAHYATEQEKESQSRAVYIALGSCIAMLICATLFMPETKGLLYGTLSESACRGIMTLVFGTAGCLAVFYLRVRVFRETPTKGPVESIPATVVSKELRSGTGGAGRSVMGYSFTVTFQTAEGQILMLYAYEDEYIRLKAGMKGTLIYRDRYFMDFEEAE